MSRLAALPHPRAPEDHEARLKALQFRLYALQTACRRAGRPGLILVEGFATEAEWRRAYGEIVETERMLADSGVTIVKLFLHISQKEQDERFRERLVNPWKRWKMGFEDFRNRRQRKGYEQAIEDMLEETDTPFAPWHLVGANSKAHARIAGLTHIAERMSEGLDLAPPPLDPDLAQLAATELGLEGLR